MSRMIGLIERVPVLRRQPAIRYALAVALSVLALLFRWQIDGVMQGYPFVTFFPPVVLISFFLGRGAGTVAAILCGLFAWCFFIPPVGTFPLDALSLIAMSFYVSVVVVDIAVIHWMQLTTERLREAREEGRLHAEESARLAERSELLFQELQHRVGNNLQMVAAVLSLQLRGLEEPRARQAIADAVARVQVIGSIQRRLHRSNGELVPLDHFMSEVCDQIMRSSARPGVTCEVDAAPGLVLPPGDAVPMALILAEALANALEHGFAERESGRIAVSLQGGNETVTLQVRDDGAGLPPGFDPSQADSLGLRISRVLSRQLGAEYTLSGSVLGTNMRLVLPASRFTVLER